MPSRPRNSFFALCGADTPVREKLDARKGRRSKPAFFLLGCHPELFLPSSRIVFCGHKFLLSSRAQRGIRSRPRLYTPRSTNSPRNVPAAITSLPTLTGTLHSRG